MYNSSFIYFKSRTTSSFLVGCFINNYFNTVPVTLRSRSGHPRSKVIHEGNRASLAVDLSLYEVYVKEEE